MDYWTRADQFCRDLKTVLARLEAKQGPFNTGDVVATPMGRGVVTAEMASTFQFPTGEEATTTIEASESNVAYVVGFGGESGVFRADDLEQTRFNKEGAQKQTDGNALATVDTIDFDEHDLPEGWNRQSLLEWWAEMGGTFSEAVNKLEDERNFSEQQAIRQAADWKSNVLGTERWRNRF